MKTLLLARAAIPAFLTALLIASAPRAEPISDYVLASFAAEERQIHEQSEFRYTYGGRTVDYVIKRILPDRLSMVVNRGDARYEVIQIGRRVYFRREQYWEEGPALDRLTDMPSLTTFLGEQLDGLEETMPLVEGGVIYRQFRMRLDWRAGAGHNQGIMEVLISSSSNLPARMKFTGACSGTGCSFDQILRYDTTIAIDAPILDR